VSLLIVSGTGTGVGKTVTTAAVAALAHARGQRVAVVKPAQTGERPGAPGDLAAVAALTGLDDLHELARYPDPLSPEAAARTAGRPPLDLRRAADHIAGLAEDRDLVVVEGAGGLLVRYDPAGTTIADLAAMLDAPVLVTAAAGLGTLNHTALTLEALTSRKLACAGVVVGSWPDDPGLAELGNLTDLEALTGQPLAGILPAGAGILGPAAFIEVARSGLGPVLGGSLDAAAFRAAAAGIAGQIRQQTGQQTIGDR
jgi:dethiobiotin synthetase